MIKEAAFEEIVLRECVENKGSRERMIQQCIDDYNEYCHLILDLYDLKRINDKYFLKIRDFTENSYNKKKIKEEEIIFLRKMFMCYKLSMSFDSALKFKSRANAQTDSVYDDDKYIEIDKKLYMQLINQMFIKMDN